MTFVKYNNPKTTRKPAINNFFEEIFGSAFNELSNTTSYRPSVNIIEDKEAHILEVAAPGLRKEDFDINLEKDTLTIKAKVEAKEADEKTSYTRREFSYQSFTRSFTLPDTVEPEGIEAKYKNGILYVTLPKKEEAKELPPRKVTIS